jgi:hypothetical protein
MAEVTIRLRIDPASGKKDIVITMRSDEDALPHEHEQQHRAIVDKLINGGIVKASELGQIVVERAEKETIPAQPGSQSEPERHAQTQGN